MEQGPSLLRPARHGLPESTSVAECERRALELVSNRRGDIENKQQQLDAQPAHTDGRWFSRLVQE